MTGAGSTLTLTGGTLVMGGNGGNGTLTIQDGGTVSAPDVTIARGASSVSTLNIGAGAGLAATSPGTLNTPTVTFGAGNGRLVFNHTSTNYTFAPVISGLGQVQLLSGTTTLTGVNTFTGATTVNGGTLAVNGSIATSSGLTVNTGGTLSGIGTLPNTIINTGGTLSPGNSVGTLQVNGNLTLNAGSIMRIEVQGATIDRVNVTGTATLGGTVTFVPTGGTYSFNSPYTFIQAGTLTGTFATSTVSGSFGAGVTPTVSYTGTEARLTLTPAALVPILNSTASLNASGGSNGNRLGVAGALDGAVARGQDVTPFFNLYNQTPGGIARGLDATSGQVGSTTTTMTVDASSQFLGAVLDPNSRGPDAGTGPLAAAGPQTIEMADVPGRTRRAAPLEPRPAIWAKAFGGFGSFRADAGVGTFAQTNSNLGIAVGADYRITPDLLVGIAMGGSSGWATNANGLGRASSDTFQTSLYGAANLGQLRLLGAVSYALTDVTTIRQIPFAAVGDITGRLKANAFSGRIEAGWRMDDVGIRGLALTPFAAFQSQWVFTPRYTEGTPNAALLPFALTYNARTNATVRTELGLRTDYAVTREVALFARVGWAAYLVRDTAFTAGFASLPGTSFTATGGRPGPHAVLGSLGVDWLITPMTMLTARVDGEISNRHAVANGTVRMQVRF